MSNSSLVSYTKLSPNHSGKRTQPISRISPHCVVGQCSVESLGDIFAPKSREASSNYGIGADGRIAMYVEEQNRSWCTSSNENDQRAVTIECASDTTEPYAFKDIVYQRLIELCIDICKRNGKKKLLWLKDKEKTLSYTPKSDEMILTVHRWFANKSCPGNWLMARMDDLADKVTAALGGSAETPETPEKPAEKAKLYRVRKTWADSKSQKGAFKNLDNAKKCADANDGYSVFDEKGTVVYSGKSEKPKAESFLFRVSISDLNIRRGPGTNYLPTGRFTGKGTFTIVEVQDGKGSTKGWGRLKSGAGWISLDHGEVV